MSIIPGASRFWRRFWPDAHSLTATSSFSSVFVFYEKAKWFRIAMELSYRSYALTLMVTLLTRGSMREHLQSPIRTLQLPNDLNESDERVMEHTRQLARDSSSTYFSIAPRSRTKSLSIKALDLTFTPTSKGPPPITELQPTFFPS